MIEKPKCICCGAAEGPPKQKYEILTLLVQRATIESDKHLCMQCLYLFIRGASERVLDVQEDIRAFQERIDSIKSDKVKEILESVL